ncbi:MAG: NTP transferase domain-containing protein, partial [Hyphomonadaceae bacterium]
MGQRAAIILAAGQGTRMKSALPKVLHKVGGRAMIDWSIDLAKRSGCETIIVVISPGSPDLRAHVEAALGADAIAVQDPPLGTGHAVQAAEAALGGFKGDVAVLYGDTPLIPASALEDLFQALETGSAMGVLGFDAADPGLYGR